MITKFVATGVTAFAGALLFSGQASAATIADGTTLQLAYVFQPDSVTTSTDGPYDYTVGVSPLRAFGQVRVIVSNSQITVNIPPGPAGGFTSALFSGIRLSDAYNVVSPFTAVTLASVTDFGFTQSRISFDADNIRLNLAGLTIGTNSAFVVSFAGTSAVPEPASWALMLIGFGAIGLAMRRRAVAVPKIGHAQATA